MTLPVLAIHRKVVTRARLPSAGLCRTDRSLEQLLGSTTSPRLDRDLEHRVHSRCSSSPSPRPHLRGSTPLAFEREGQSPRGGASPVASASGKVSSLRVLNLSRKRDEELGPFGVSQTPSGPLEEGILAFGQRVFPSLRRRKRFRKKAGNSPSLDTG